MLTKQCVGQNLHYKGIAKYSVIYADRITKESLCQVLALDLCEDKCQ